MMRPEPVRFMFATLLTFVAVAVLSALIGTLIPASPVTAALLAVFVFLLVVAWQVQWRRHIGLWQQEGERRFRTVFEHTAQAMARNAIDGEFLEVNDAWCAIFGYSCEEMQSRHLSWQQLTHPEDLDPESTPVKRLLAGEIEEFRVEKRYIRKDGRILWGVLQVTLVRDEQGRPQYFISAIQDITERKQAEQMVSYMAYHDRLTGLPNRALLFDRLSQAMSQARRDGNFVALMFVDLDGFKAVNDLHGHEAGDAVLKVAAQRFLACVRAVDTVARLGGDEFAVVLGSLEAPDQAGAVADKIVQAFVQGIQLPDGSEVQVGASVGISVYPEHGGAMDSLMTAADRAMYDCKRNGKSCYSYFHGAAAESGLPWIRFDDSHLVGVHEIDEQHRNLVYLANRLHDAVKHGETLEAVKQMFDELLVATAHHFETESRYMERHHYPEKVEHEQEHARLVAEALHMKGQLSQGGEQLALQSIKDWLIGHISYSDKKLGTYLTHHEVK